MANENWCRDYSQAVVFPSISSFYSRFHILDADLDEDRTDLCLQSRLAACRGQL